MFHRDGRAKEIVSISFGFSLNELEIFGNFHWILHYNQGHCFTSFRSCVCVCVRVLCVRVSSIGSVGYDGEERAREDKCGDLNE